MTYWCHIKKIKLDNNLIIYKGVSMKKTLLVFIFLTVGFAVFGEEVTLDTLLENALKIADTPLLNDDAEKKCMNLNRKKQKHWKNSIK